MKHLSALAATLFALLIWQGIVTLTGLPKFICPDQPWWLKPGGKTGVDRRARVDHRS